MIAWPEFDAGIDRSHFGQSLLPVTVEVCRPRVTTLITL
jgi:hypothetical protein